MGDAADLRPVIYVAGPFTTGSESANVRRALLEADKLWTKGWAPIVPHLSMHWDMVTPRRYSEWMTWCLSIVAQCEAVCLMPGPSRGAEREVALAEHLRMKVFKGFEEVPLARDFVG